MSDVTPDPAARLEKLSSKELHDLAVARARERRDVGFVWELLRAIPAAAASLGNVDRARFDLLHGLSLLEELTHADEGAMAEALRPLYLDYLVRHGPPSET
ncbi:hypothetical protein ACFY4C_32675 [Actinomadura viridis]|uniref:hypothetical protein n=1 Tax=Actinomadura viridis TaxID=58110 RepID=UPI00369CA6D0